MVPWVGIQCAIVVFPDHTHLWICNRTGYIRKIDDRIYNIGIRTNLISLAELLKLPWNRQINHVTLKLLYFALFCFRMMYDVILNSMIILTSGSSVIDTSRRKR